MPRPQVTNMLFRMGAAGMLFSNKASMAQVAKYDLLYNHRVHIGANDDAYRSVTAARARGRSTSCGATTPPPCGPRRAIWYGPDAEGIRGVYLGKNVVSEAGLALAKVMRHLAPR